MRIGFIVGKDDEIYNDDYIFNLTPKKYLQYGELHTDVAIAITVKNGYPDINVDIILPRELSVERLKKNNVNFILGYDCINQMLGEPYVRKFSGKKGYNKLYSIYSNKSSKIFPPIDFLEFIWNKHTYLKKMNQKKIPITPTITVENFNHQKILGTIQKKGWNNFIIKPVGGTIAVGVEVFCSKKCISDPSVLQKYFDDQTKYYKIFLIQEQIKGFKKYGEIKMYWINGDYSYAVNTPAGAEPGEDYTVKLIKDKEILNQCKLIGKEVLNSLPKIKVGDKNITPVLVRTDFTCCKENKKHSPNNYFLNEIEHQDAGSYVNFENVKYPYVQIMADNFVKKAQELVDAGF